MGARATGRATGSPTVVVAVLQFSRFTATRWRRLMPWKSDSLAEVPDAGEDGHWEIIGPAVRGCKGQKCGTPLGPMITTCGL